MPNPSFAAPPIVCSTCGAKDCTVTAGDFELLIHCPTCARELERLREVERELEHLTIQDELTCQVYGSHPDHVYDCACSVCVEWGWLP
jgi:hypothetical protein